jgi:predicted permease
MSLLPNLLGVFRNIFRKQVAEKDLDDEVRSYVELLAEEKIKQGMTPAEARRAARIEAGGVEQVKEEVRDARVGAWLDTLLQDVRYGIRMLVKSPGFTIVAVLTLALGIGANTAIFSVVNAVLLESLPYREPAQLMTVLETKSSQGLDWLYITPANFLEWRRRATMFESIAASHGCGFRLADANNAKFVLGACASASFFPMLRVQPILGRLWSPEEDLPGRDHVAVLSYEFWRQQYGSDPGVIGKTIQRNLDSEPYTIIGVLPSGFQFANENVSVWAPLDLDASGQALRYHSQLVFARLKPGVTREQAQSEMDGMASQLEREFPQTNTGWGITVQPLQRFFSNMENTRNTLLVLLAAVGLLLLIACANIANLLLARATVRQREMAVRAALGATRFRLIRQLFTESLVLGLLGGAAGFLLAWTAFGWLIAIAPRIPSFRPHAIRIDGGIFAFAMAASLLASIVFGLTPALRISKQDLNESLRQTARGAQGTVRDRAARYVLVIGEIALAVVLLAGTGLLIESFRNLQNDRLGFSSGHVLTVGVCCLYGANFSTQQQINLFYRQLFDRLRSLPGVESASATSGLPLRLFDGAGSPFMIQGRPVPNPGHETLSDSRLVEPDFFQTMRIPLLRGRSFTAADDEDHALVAVINETMAHRHWPGGDPVGQQIQLVNLQPLGRWFTVVGVAADSKDRGLGKDTRSMVYLNDLQNEARGAVLLVRTKADPHALIAGVRETLRSVNRDAWITNAKTLDEALAESLSPQRFSVTLLTLFAVLALALASVGVYGVTAYTVAQRTHEIGVRMALGAGPRDIVMLIVGQGLRLTLIGVAAGLVGALALMRLMTSLFFGVSPHDPFTLIFTCAALSAVALLACYLPARRAMKVDPMEALRYE